MTSEEEPIIQTARGRDQPRRGLVLPLVLLWLLAILLATTCALSRPGQRLSLSEYPTGLPSPEALNPAGAALWPAARHPTNDLELHAATLRLEQLRGLSAETIAARSQAMAALVQRNNLDPSQALASLLPDRAWFQARLILPRDEPTLRDDSRVQGPYGEEYRQIIEKLPEVRQYGGLMARTLDRLWLDLGGQELTKGGLVSPLKPRDRWIPPERSLPASHRYALDVFFTWLERDGAVEHGPEILSISRGIVVAAAADWQGGDRPSLYQGGGLSPKAGNGVIVYDPEQRRYYAYFHLGLVVVETGQLVSAGQVLGHGGNTGVNARRRGHGGHVHLEIIDEGGATWSSYQIRSFLLGLR